MGSNLGPRTSGILTIYYCRFSDVASPFPGRVAGISLNASTVPWAMGLFKCRNLRGSAKYGSRGVGVKGFHWLMVLRGHHSCHPISVQSELDFQLFSLIEQEAPTLTERRARRIRRGRTRHIQLPKYYRTQQHGKPYLVLS